MLPSGRFRVLWCLVRSAPWRAHWSALRQDRRFRIRGAFIDRAIRVTRAGPLTRPRTRTPTRQPTLNRRRVVKPPVRRQQQHRLHRHDRPPLPRRPPRCRRCRRWNRRRMRVANACCLAHHRDRSFIGAVPTRADAAAIAPGGSRAQFWLRQRSAIGRAVRHRRIPDMTSAPKPCWSWWHSDRADTGTASG